MSEEENKNPNNANDSILSIGKNPIVHGFFIFLVLSGVLIVASFVVLAVVSLTLGNVFS